MVTHWFPRLEKKSFEVKRAYSGEEALEALEKEKFDAIVTDIKPARYEWY